MTIYEERKYYLIYVVLDTSESMRVDPLTGHVRSGDLRGTPQGTFKWLIPKMLRRLADNPVVNGIASVSVLAFNERQQVLRPMSFLNEPAAIAAPDEGTETDYAGILRFIARRRHADAERTIRARAGGVGVIKLAQPWIFFITDGRAYAGGADQPVAEWLRYRDELVSGRTGARIVTIGLPGADERALWQLATGDDRHVRNALIANDREADPNSLVRSVVDAIQRSISASTSAGTLTISVPAGMRRIERRW